MEHCLVVGPCQACQRWSCCQHGENSSVFGALTACKTCVITSESLISSLGRYSTRLPKVEPLEGLYGDTIQLPPSQAAPLGGSGLSVGHPAHCLIRLHEVEPLEGLEMLPPAALSRLVAAKALRTVPYPLLGENTLVISDSLVLAPDDQGRLALLFRHGGPSPNPLTHSSLMCWCLRRTTRAASRSCSGRGFPFPPSRCVPHGMGALALARTSRAPLWANGR